MFSSFKALSIFLPGDNIKQGGCHSNILEIISKQIDPHWRREGVCDELADLYIEYADNGNKETFFSELQLLSDIKKNEIDLVMPFVNKIYQMTDRNSALLNDRYCYDAFAFAVESEDSLQKKMHRVMSHMQSYSQNIYAKATFGNMHSFVLEQCMQGKKFIYYIYDSNNPYLPKPLYTLDEITEELNLIMDRLKATEIINSFFYSDNKKLISFCLYPTNTKNEEDSFISDLQSCFNDKMAKYYESIDLYYDLLILDNDDYSNIEIKHDYAYVISRDNYGISIYQYNAISKTKGGVGNCNASQLENIKQTFFPEGNSRLLEGLSWHDLFKIRKIIQSYGVHNNRLESKLVSDIELLFFKYNEYNISRSVLLSNLLDMLNALSHITGIDFTHEIDMINIALSGHLLSLELMDKNTSDFASYFNYFKDVGRATLFHEVMRFGDIKASQYLLEHLTPMFENYLYETPLDTAIREGHTYLVRDMLEFITDKDDKLFDRIDLYMGRGNISISTKMEMIEIFFMMEDRKRILESPLIQKKL